MIRLLVLLMGLASASMVAAETVYKWTDEDGGIHYGSRPPEGADQVQSVRLQAAPPPPATAAQPQSASSTTTDTGAAPAAATETVSVDPAVQDAFEFDQKINAQVRQENCRRAQHNFAVLQTTPRVGKRTEDGSYEYVRLDDEDRANRMQHAQDQIQQYCG